MSNSYIDYIASTKLLNTEITELIDKIVFQWYWIRCASHFATYSLRGSNRRARCSFHPNFPFAQSTPLSNIALIRIWRKFSTQKFQLRLASENSQLLHSNLSTRTPFFRGMKHFRNYIRHFRQKSTPQRSNNSFGSKIYPGKSATPRIQLLWTKRQVAVERRLEEL